MLFSLPALQLISLVKVTVTGRFRVQCLVKAISTVIDMTNEIFRISCRAGFPLNRFEGKKSRLQERLITKRCVGAELDLNSTSR